MKNYSLATQLLQRLIEQKDLEIHDRNALQLALGRIYLQCGDLFSAEDNFNKVFSAGDQAKTIAECINVGLLKVAKGDFEDALKLFEEGLKIQPKNIMVSL